MRNIEQHGKGKCRRTMWKGKGEGEGGFGEVYIFFWRGWDADASADGGRSRRSGIESL